MSPGQAAISLLELETLAHLAKKVGADRPVDKVIVHEFSQQQPYWLQFRSGKGAGGRGPAEGTDEGCQIAKREGNRRFWKRDE